MTTSLSQASLGQIPFNTGSHSQLLDQINRWLSASSEAKVANNCNRLITFINPHVFNLSFDHHQVRECLNRADAVCIDGIGIKLAIFFKSGRWLPRVVAEHLFEIFLHSLDYRVMTILIGGQPGIVEKAAGAMHKTNSNLCIQSTLDGYCDISTYKNFILQNKHAELVLIGAGTPHSEELALLANKICSSAIIFHIGGGTLNTYSGTKKRGPKWISRVGLEWLHRIVFEPHTRHRYTVGGWKFFKNLVTIWKYTTNKEPTL